MMSHFNDVTLADLWLAPIPRLSGSVGGYIDSVRVCMCTLPANTVSKTTGHP